MATCYLPLEFHKLSPVHAKSTAYFSQKHTISHPLVKFSVPPNVVSDSQLIRAEPIPTMGARNQISCIS